MSSKQDRAIKLLEKIADGKPTGKRRSVDVKTAGKELEIINSINSEDREFVRDKLVEAAEYIHRRYDLNFHGIRRFLDEMLTVSV